MATQQKREGPQSRAALKWAGGAKNPTASRHLECPTDCRATRSPEKEDKLRKNEVREASRKRRNEMDLGTWNVRTMNRKGKLENVKEEMRRSNVSVLGLCEVRWKGGGDFYSDGYRIMYEGGEQAERGVGIILNGRTANKVMSVERISDRLMMIKLNAEPVDVVIIQVYMPTTEHDDEEVDQMYEQIEELIKKQKGKDNLVVMGDWNAVVGEEGDEKVVGKYGLGERNERGEKLVEFCKRNKLIVSNTWFQQEKRRRYTWKKPGDTARYQLDYILVRQRFRNSVKRSWSYPGADADSDHNLVKMKMEVKLKNIKRRKGQQKWNMTKFQKEKERFKDVVESRLEEWIGKQETSVENQWQNLKTAVVESAQESIGYNTGRVARKLWVTTEMLEKMDERRKWKRINSDLGRQMYRKLNNELRRDTEKAREIWWESECRELEEMDRRGRPDLVYAKVKKMSGKEKTYNMSAAINNEKGELLTEVNDIKNRWKVYTEELYHKDGKPDLEEMRCEEEDKVQIDCKGPSVLESEVRAAIKDLKNGKASGVDGIPAEFLKALGEKGTRKVIELCQKIYEAGIWPKDFTRVVMIPIQKKVNAKECGDYRTISLVSHASKILLKILNKRIEARAKGFIGRNQFGFRAGCGTRDAIGVMRSICERSLEFGNDVYICFVDFEKAFDRVKWTKLMKILEDIKVDWRDRRLIQDLYMRQEAVIRIANEETEPAIIGRGVRQGCPLSPLLFSKYAEMMMIEAFEDSNEGIKVGGEVIRDVRFADDQGMLASSEGELQTLMKRLEETAKEYDMKVNVKKTKVMVVSKEEGKIANIVIDGQKIEQVEKFKYLGAVISQDNRCIKEIKARIGMAKDAFNKRKELLNKRFSKKLKKKMVKTLIWPVALYGCETWTMNKEALGRLEAFEMWVWRRCEKVSWKDKKKNEEVLDLVEEERSLVNSITKRKKNWIGHVLRGNTLLKVVLEGRMAGKRGRGRPRKGMIDDIKEGNYERMKRKAEDREGWRGWLP